MSSSEVNKALRRLTNRLMVYAENATAAGRSKKQLVVGFVDACLAFGSLWLAYSLRLSVPFTDFASSWHLFVLMPILSVLVFASLGVYKWVIRTSNERLLLVILKGGIICSGLLLAMMFLLPPSSIAPRSLFVIFGANFVLSTAAVRMIWLSIFRDSATLNSRVPIGIYGAGMSGHRLASLMRYDEKYRPVCFFDDNPALWKTTVNGLPVYSGDRVDIDSAIRRYSLERLILAVPSAKAVAYTAILKKLSDLPIPVQTIPSVTELVTGAAAPDQVRDLSITDLLGRSEVEPDPKLLSQCVTNKVVLVTGGGGSIGSEICRQIMNLSPRKLLVFDQGEENLYKITEELEALETSLSQKDVFVPVLGSVENSKKVSSLISEYAVDTVYHAAAYKHVPIVEKNPEEAVDVNVFGTLSVLDAAIENGVKNFTLISTDKAVRPANYMGASKRLAELILQSKADLNHNTTICMVRFGNVLGSSGSVVPKFKRQILEGGPLTVTHPDITRYFMTIPEASQLVLQASALAEGGEVFVLDMGEPVRIIDLARSMIQLSGKRLKSEEYPDGDIEIKIEGLRPGEKMYEELFIGDSFDQTEISRIFVTHEDYVSWDELQTTLSSLRSTDHSHADYLETLNNIMRLAGLRRGHEQKYLDRRRGLQAVKKPVVVDQSSESFALETASGDVLSVASNDSSAVGA